jgi:hypothetical protein
VRNGDELPELVREAIDVRAAALALSREEYLFRVCDQIALSVEAVALSPSSRSARPVPGR